MILLFDAVMRWAYNNYQPITMLVATLAVLALIARLCYCRRLSNWLVTLALVEFCLDLLGSFAPQPAFTPPAGSYELDAPPPQANLLVTEDLIPAPPDHYAMQELLNGETMVDLGRVDFHF